MSVTPLRRKLPPAEAGRVLPFRRRRVHRSRRHPMVRLLKPLLLAMVIVGAPIGATAWALTSPRFAFENIRVVSEGEGRIEPAWVEMVLSDMKGGNLWRLSLAEAEERLLRHPWLRTVSLRKEPPETLIAALEERHEAALLRTREGLVYLDVEGQPVTRYDMAHESADLPIVSRGDSGVLDMRCVIDLLLEIESVAPAWGRDLSEVEVLGARDFRLYTASLPFPLLVRAGTLEPKARRLEELLPHIVARYGTVAAVDLRFRRRIIVQPSVRGASSVVS